MDNFKNKMNFTEHNYNKLKVPINFIICSKHKTINGDQEEYLFSY